MRELVLYSIGIAIIAAYIITSLRSTLSVQKSNRFRGKVRTFHLAMIWLIPFAWSWLLKTLIKPIPGSHQAEKKADTEPFHDAYRIGE